MFDYVLVILMVDDMISVGKFVILIYFLYCKKDKFKVWYWEMFCDFCRVFYLNVFVIYKIIFKRKYVIINILVFDKFFEWFLMFIKYVIFVGKFISYKEVKKSWIWKVVIKNWK